jgi:hypothetical protein
MKKTFVFYNDWIDYTIEMSLEEKWLFLQTILKYQNWEDLWDIGSIKYIWARIKNQLDEDNNKWSEEREKRSKAGIEWNKKRWEDNSKSSQVIASAITSSQLIADNVNVNVNDNVNENINKSIIISTIVDTKQVSVVEEFGKDEINIMQKFLRQAVWVSAFKDSKERWYVTHCYNLMKKIGKQEFQFRLKEILSDPFKAKNSNKLAYLYWEIKSYIHSPVVEEKKPKVLIF